MRLWYTEEQHVVGARGRLTPWDERDFKGERYLKVNNVYRVNTVLAAILRKGRRKDLS